MSNRYSVECSVLDVLAVEANQEAAQFLIDNPLGPDDDPSDGLDEFVVTVKITVKDSVELAGLRLMAEGTHRVNILTA